MVEMSRRKLLSSAGGVLGAAAAATLLPPNLRKALAQTPNPGPLSDIKHVVVLMQENRSFDHYFGTMRGVRGFDDPNMGKLPNGKSLLYQPDAKNPDGYLLPFHLDTKTTSSQAIPSTSHAWEVQHQAWNNGKMDNWLPAHRKADGDARGPYTMSYYQRDDIPFQFALAESFTICDRYHCSLLGPTWPNRLYHWTGMIDPNGTGGGPITSNVVDRPYGWTTCPERLTKAGVSWHVYQEEDDYGCNPLKFFANYQNAKVGSTLYKSALTISAADQFAQDAMNDRLPTVSWIIPTAPQCEHPDYLPASGADFVARQLDAVAANPEVWNKTVFILNYDENDGLFDHMIPPTPPAGTKDEFVNGLPIGAGIRVPCIIVSPWTQGGFVAQEPFDHTSVLQFLERITGVQETNITDWRRNTFGDLTSALGLGKPSAFPQLPATKDALWEAEHNVATLPPTQLPGADQTPPHQDTSGKAARTSITPAAVTLSGSRPQSLSRVVENATTHRADFPSGFAGTNFPGITANAVDATPSGRAAGTETAYIPAITNGTIGLIDTASHKLIGGIKSGTQAYGVTKASATKLYVTNSGASDVSIVDTTTNKITGAITVGLYPHGITTSPDGKLAYVANTGPDTGPGGSRDISVIDVASDKVVSTITAGTAPHSLAISPDGKTLYATCFDGLSVIDIGSGLVRTTVAGQARGGGVAVTSDSRFVFVVNTLSNSVSVLNATTNKVATRISVGKTPWKIALSPDGSKAYVTNSSSDTVSVIDTAHPRVLATVTDTGHIPTAVAATADQILVSTNTSSVVTAIDAKTNQVISKVPIGISSQPSEIVFVQH